MRILLLIPTIIFFAGALVFLVIWLTAYVRLLRRFKLKHNGYYQKIGAPALPAFPYRGIIAAINYCGYLFDGNPPGFPKDKTCQALANTFRRSVRYFIVLFVAAIPFYVAILLLNN